jgi:hypothetical protein
MPDEIGTHPASRESFWKKTAEDAKGARKITDKISASSAFSAVKNKNRSLR